VRLAGLLPELRVTAQSLALADSIQRLPVAEVAPGEFPKEWGRDLRRQLTRQMEDQIERKLKTVRILEAA
jgi:hypothetical protein